MSELEPICPIIKDMTNQDSDFLHRWLSGESIPPEDIMGNSKLDLGWNIGDRIHEDSPKAYAQALNSGLPPLPKEAKNFANILFHQNQPEGILSPKPKTNLWDNLNGEWFNEIELSLNGTAFRQGLNKMRCKHLSLENMSGDWSFDDMPELGIADDLSVLQIRRCSGAPRLAETLADYLSNMKTQNIKLNILETNWVVIDPRIFEVLFRDFESLKMEIYKSLQPGFMESCQKAIDKIWEKKLDVISPNYQKIRELRDRREKNGHNNFFVQTDVPPLRRTDLLMERDLPIYWNDKHISDPQYSHESLEW